MVTCEAFLSRVYKCCRLFVSSCCFLIGPFLVLCPLVLFPIGLFPPSLPGISFKASKLLGLPSTSPFLPCSVLLLCAGEINILVVWRWLCPSGTIPFPGTCPHCLSHLSVLSERRTCCKPAGSRMCSQRGSQVSEGPAHLSEGVGGA